MRRVLVFSELCEESRNPSTHFFKGEKECPPLAREKGGGKITSKKSPNPLFQRRERMSPAGGGKRGWKNYFKEIPRPNFSKGE
jgi:hypothetical protein